MRFLQVFLLLLAIGGPSGTRADETEERAAIGKTVAQAFLSGRFSELDAMADRFRNGRERTESGFWKSVDFYQGFYPRALDLNYDAASFDRFEKQALAWMKARPKSIAAKLAYAIILEQHAWFLRGNDSFNNLTEEQVAGFVKYHMMERNHLVAIEDEASVDPHWYLLMVMVAKQEGWPDRDFDRLLSEAAAREPYYYQTYLAAIERDLPQWGGSIAKIEALIARATEYTREQEGESFRARAYWWASGLDKGIVDSWHKDWATVSQGLNDLVDRYPSQLNFNIYAKFACLAKDRTKFMYAYGHIKPQLTDLAWDYGDQGVICAVWALHPERNIEVR
jgi:hypothetical protein